MKSTLLRTRRRLSHTRIDGVEWYWPADESPARARADTAVRFLAPFDPIVWDRRRFECSGDGPTASRRIRRCRGAARLLCASLAVAGSGDRMGQCGAARAGAGGRCGFRGGTAPTSAAFARALEAEIGPDAAVSRRCLTTPGLDGHVRLGRRHPACAIVSTAPATIRSKLRRPTGTSPAYSAPAPWRCSATSPTIAAPSPAPAARPICGRRARPRRRTGEPRAPPGPATARPDDRPGRRRDDERGDDEPDGVEATAAVGLFPRPEEKGEREDDTDHERDQPHHRFLPGILRVSRHALMNPSVNSR